MRDHQPYRIENYKGLWKRGDADSCPSEHFTNCNNIQFSEGSVLSRFGIGPYAPFKNVVRQWVFNQSVLILDTDGNIYVNDLINKFTPILHIDGMTDFSAAKYANRAYIAPQINNGPGDSLYVYIYADQVNGARKAGGDPPTSAVGFTVNAAGSGNCEQGIRVIAVVYETNTGFLTQIGPKIAVQVPDGGCSISLTIPTSPNNYVRKRHIVVTQSIDPADYTGNTNGYQFFFLDTAVVNDNTSATVDISYFDAELLSDASYLEDLYNPIPSCAGVNIYHQRLIGWYPDDGGNNPRLSDVIVSFPGEPEAFSKVDGLISLTPDGKSLTYGQEYRDTLYLFKNTKTWAVTDNGDVASTWPSIIVDNGIGSGARGVATIMDSGGVNAEFLVVADYTGLLLFDGKYNLPELSWKIKDMWASFDRSQFVNTQTVINSQDHIIYIAFPDGSMVIGDYNNGMNPMEIKWAPWTFDVKATTVVIIESGGIFVLIGTKEASH